MLIPPSLSDLHWGSLLAVQSVRSPLANSVKSSVNSPMSTTFWNFAHQMEAQTKYFLSWSQRIPKVFEEHKPLYYNRISHPHLTAALLRWQIIGWTITACEFQSNTFQGVRKMILAPRTRYLSHEDIRLFQARHIFSMPFCRSRRKMILAPRTRYLSHEDIRLFQARHIFSIPFCRSRRDPVNVNYLLAPQKRHRSCLRWLGAKCL